VVEPHRSAAEFRLSIYQKPSYNAALRTAEAGPLGDTADCKKLAPPGAARDSFLQD
jgi:hypothetical protein